MATDSEIIRRYCSVDERELALLQSPESPIVILQANGPERVAQDVAPGQPTLGFMLPYTPLHHLLLQKIDRPIVLTSGNLSEEPQCIDNDEARERLGGIADYALTHDRPIVNRVDDSVVRIMAGEARVLRRARGYAPAPIPLPSGFESAPDLLAMGPELKNTFCLIADGRAVLSQHIGDLEDAATHGDYRRNLDLLQSLYEHEPKLISVDCHPEYLSTKLGYGLAERGGLPLDEVQHHHAHVAACMAENGVPLEADPVLGIALDGLGYGVDGTFWGGEFLLANYLGFERLGTFKPVAMLGGARAMREPWRNTYAHLMAAMGWPRYRTDYETLELTRFLESRPLETLGAMLSSSTNAPPASSCGRLFDAVAAAMGICREQVSYEGQAAVELEAAVNRSALRDEPDERAYPFAISLANGTGIRRVEPAAMWQALLGDLALNTPVSIMAARFHRGLAIALVRMAENICTQDPERVVKHVALTGGVFQNCTLLELVCEALQTRGFDVLTHRLVPPNDGGIALGQAVVTAARALRADATTSETGES